MQSDSPSGEHSCWKEKSGGTGKKTMEAELETGIRIDLHRQDCLEEGIRVDL